MPKFVPMFDVSESDDDIEILPYVKPPPPIIEILNSSSGEDVESPESQQKGEKKKKKKKKKREDEGATANGLTENNNDCDDNNAPSSSGTTSHKSNVGKNNENIPEREIVQGMHNVQVGFNEELSVMTLSSANAAAPCTLSRSDDITSDEPLPSIRIASSIFEFSESTLDQPVEQIIPVKTVSIPGGPVKRIAAGTSKVTQSKSKANAKASTPRAPRQRISKHRIASQRTNEEILNFLTTLGIPLEPQDLEPNKRVRKPRKTAAQLQLENGAVSSGLSAVSADKEITFSLENPLFPSIHNERKDLSSVTPSGLSLNGSFVSLTEEIKVHGPSPPSFKISPKRRISLLSKKTKVDSGGASDLSDTSFTKKDLQNISLNMTSNVIFASNLEGRQRSVSVIEDNSKTIGKKTKGKQNEVSVADAILIEMETLDAQGVNNCPEPIPSTSQSQTPPKSKELESGSQAMDGETPANSPDEIERVASVSSIMQQDLQLTESPTLYTSLNKSLNQLLDNNNDLAVDPLNSSPLMVQAVTTTPPENQLNGAVESVTSPQIRTAISHLPSHWSEQMIEFYDTIRDPDVHSTDVKKCMSDNPTLWRVRHLPPKPKFKYRIRCMNCNQMGHVARNCPDPRKPTCCKVCGSQGHTASTESRRQRGCPNTMCLNCGRAQHKYSTSCYGCSDLRRPVECKLCFIEGHEEPMCPDNWRRYHSTISENENTTVIAGNVQPENGEQAKYQLSRNMYCSICARKGHSYYGCREHHRLSYHRNKPYIMRELPGTIKSIVTVETTSLPTLPDRTVSLQTQDSGDEETIEIIKVQIANQFASRGGRKTAYKTWRCLSYPNCQN